MIAARMANLTRGGAMYSSKNETPIGDSTPAVTRSTAKDLVVRIDLSTSRQRPRLVGVGGAACGAGRVTAPQIGPTLFDHRSRADPLQVPGG